MAKKSEPNNASRFERESRIKRIENCTQCHGNPNVENFNLQGLVGTHCGTCMEIISYHKEGKPIVVEEKRVVIQSNSHGSKEFQKLDYENLQTKINKFIPGVGTFDFNELKLE